MQKQKIGVNCIKLSFCHYISRKSKLLSTINSNDAQIYYDRIVLWIASLVLQMIGLSKEATSSMIRTLQLTTHDINTVFGVSIEK